MGIYIPNMEMPTQCGNCPISTNTRRCTILWREFGDPSKRLEDCPLVPLPEGHGRLIDADALLEQIRDGFEKAEQWRDAVENDPEIRPRAEATVVAFWECGAKVKMAPTIVPAEGGGEDG